MRTKLLRLLLPAALAVAGCGSPESGSDSTNPPVQSNFAAVQAVFDRHCTGCHSGGNDLDLKSAGVRERLLSHATACWDPDAMEPYEKPVVAPGDPAGSALWHKMANIDLHCGREMPPMGTGGLIADAPEDFLVVEGWIKAGAPE